MYFGSHFQILDLGLEFFDGVTLNWLLLSTYWTHRFNYRGSEISRNQPCSFTNQDSIMRSIYLCSQLVCHTAFWFFHFKCLSVTLYQGSSSTSHVTSGGNVDTTVSQHVHHCPHGHHHGSSKWRHTLKCCKGFYLRRIHCFAISPSINSQFIFSFSIYLLLLLFFHSRGY